MVPSPSLFGQPIMGRKSDPRQPETSAALIHCTTSSTSISYKNQCFSKRTENKSTKIFKKWEIINCDKNGQRKINCDTFELQNLNSNRTNRITPRKNIHTHKPSLGMKRVGVANLEVAPAAPPPD